LVHTHVREIEDRCSNLESGKKMVLRGKVGIEDKVGVKKLNSKVCVVGE
jgi:hypothetical protein